MTRLRTGIEDPKAWLSIIYGDEYQGKWAGSKIDEEGNVQRLHVPKSDPASDCYINLSDISTSYPRGRKKTRKTDIVGTRWVWADFDPPKVPIEGEFDASGNPKMQSVDGTVLDQWRTETFDTLLACETIRIHYLIDSGRGFWAVAKLSKQVPPDDADLVIRAYGQALSAQTKLEYDKQSVDVSRIVRLPGTINQKSKIAAQYYEVLIPEEENFIDADVWIDAIKEKQKREIEEYKPTRGPALSLTLQEAITRFNNDHAYALGVCPELSAQVEHLQGKSAGAYLEWAVEGRTSKSKGGLTCKIASGRFHVHSATLSTRFGIALPNPSASYDLLDLCVMAKWQTGGPTHIQHRTCRVDFLEETGYYQRKKAKSEPIAELLEDDLEETKKIVDNIWKIASGAEVPDRLMNEVVNIWEENRWFANVLLVAQKNDVPPAAVLMSVLVRCSAAAGGAVDGGVRRLGYDEPVPLSLYVILSGPIASGKTMSNKIAKRFCPLEINAMNDGINVVSAAGLAETYVIRDKETEHQTDSHSKAIFHYDEGDITSSRTTAEHGLASGLREIWSTGTLKQVRAEAKNTRHIANVGIGLTMGIQPGNHCAIIDDEWGLNERTLYAIVRDPQRLAKDDRRAIPDIPPMEKIHPRLTTLCVEADDLLEQLRDAVVEEFTLPEWAESVPRRHGDLNLMKLAALMGCIRDPMGIEDNEITIQDFRLGLLLMEMSNAAKSLHEEAQSQKRAASQDKNLVKTVHRQRRQAEIKADMLHTDKEDAESITWVNIKKLGYEAKDGFTITEAQRKCAISGTKAKDIGTTVSQFTRDILQEMMDEGMVEKRKKRYYLIHEN